MLIGLGTNAILRPKAHLKSLEFPVHTEPQLKKLNHALMQIWGIRNISFGSVLTIIWTTGDEKLMGKALCVSIVLPVMDGLVSRSLIGGGELQHWIFPPVLGLVAAGLFGWFDR